jgi:hypothetical protein
VLVSDKITIIYNNKTISALFESNKVVPIPEINKLEVQRVKKSASDTTERQYLLVEDKKGKITIYNNRGITFIKPIYDKITTFSKNVFVVEQKGKTGIVDSTGKVILPIKYDGIGNFDGTYISILQKSHFGIFGATAKVLIEPRFDAQVKVFDPVGKIFLANDNGNYAFIDHKGKLLSEHKFKDVNLWKNDTVLVKEGSEQYLYSIKTKQKVSDSFQSFKIYKDTPEEKLAMVYKNSVYGVLSNQKGIIIPIKYNDITNLGSVERPFYMAEHHVQEADLYVVLYINYTGKIVMSQAYKSADYDKVLCQE